jgi:hypothetical protein
MQKIGAKRKDEFLVNNSTHYIWGTDIWIGYFFVNHKELRVPTLYVALYEFDVFDNGNKRVPKRKKSNRLLFGSCICLRTNCSHSRIYTVLKYKSERNQMRKRALAF